MKIKMVLILSLALYHSGIYASGKKACESSGIPSVSNTVLDDIITTGRKVTNDEFVKIRNRLCTNIYLAVMGGFDSKKFKNIILDGVGTSSSASNANKIISEFLNTNNDRLICPKSKIEVSDRDTHLFKTALLKGVMDLFDEILLNDEYKIDFNAVEIVEGKEETIIDYIDKLIAKDLFDSDELLMLKMDIQSLGGKKGSEL